MRTINMLIASLPLTAAMAAERNQEQGIELSVLSQEQSAALAGNFALAPSLESARLPGSVALSSDDIFTFGFTTGIHFVLWEGNDPLHQIQWYVLDGEHFKRMGIKFTVSPPASEGMTLSEMLAR